MCVTPDARAAAMASAIFALIDYVRARIRDMNDDRAQTGGIHLTAEQVLTYPMHADAVKLVGHRSQGADNFEFACNSRLMQRPCAVFTARPCNKSFGRRRHGIQSIADRFRP